MIGMDEAKEIRRTVDTGEVFFGERESEKNLLNGIGKIIIVSKNTNKETVERIAHIAELAGIPFYQFKGNSIELGSVCGKPYPVSMLLVKSVGKSKILEIVGKVKE